MNEPLVAIAMAAYNPNIEYFRDQLQSIVDQTYTNWFCVIGFDSPISEVNTEPTLVPFFSDPRFRFIQNENTRGVVGNFESTGTECLKRNPKYIAYSDQDDVWYQNKVTKLVSSLEQCPPMSIVHCDMNIFMRQSDGSFKNLYDTAWKLERRGVHNVSPLDLFIRNVAAGAGMLMDADLIRRYPKIPGEVFGQDHWYPLIASYFGKVVAVNEPLYAYRIHGDNVSGIGPYLGFFKPSRSSLQNGVVDKCIIAFNSSRARLQRAIDAQLPVTNSHKLIVRFRSDLGLGYFCEGGNSDRK